MEKKLARDPQTRIAWIYALGCAQTEAAQAMTELWSWAKGELPPFFEAHLEDSLNHGKCLKRIVLHQRKALGQDPGYALLEEEMTHSTERYVRTLLGYTERQTIYPEAQYCVAALAMESRLFRHFSKLGRETALSGTFSQIISKEAQYSRILQVLLHTLPRDAQCVYRSVRSFEEMLFERIVRKLIQSLHRHDRSASKRPANDQRLMRCV